jgi:hypothetical protein
MRVWTGGACGTVRDRNLKAAKLILAAGRRRLAEGIPAPFRAREDVNGQDSQFHETHGYYADPVDESTATLPKGWKGRLVNLPPGDTQGVSGLCLDPHDLAIAKYVARREKDIVFTRALAARGMVEKPQLLALLAKTPIDAESRERIRGFIESDFK